MHLERLSRRVRRFIRSDRGDEGFTLIELLVTLVVVSIVMAFTGILLVMLERSFSNATNSVQALQEEEIASNAILPYLHSAAYVTAAGPNSFTVDTYAGINDYNTGTGTYGSPSAAQLTVTLATCTTTSDPCDGQTTGYQFIAALTNNCNDSSGMPCTTSTSSVTTTIVASDSQAPSTHNPYTFTYWNDSSYTQNTAEPTQTIPGTQLGITGSDGGTVPNSACALEQINRIDIDVNFLSGNQKGGNEANEVTSWKTSLYLQDVTDTTSTTSTTNTCTT